MDLTEGNHWQYRFHAWQNVDGLAGKFGGITEMCDAIHEFNTQFHGYVHAGTYGHGWTHEMLEKGLSCWGQAAHNNQPSHHIQYMFIDAPPEEPSEDEWNKCIYRGQRAIRKTLLETYDPLHFAGDEDNGEMS
eukprot:Polyplicarium_translucidae@DN3380_c3_g4_i6.p2